MAKNKKVGHLNGSGSPISVRYDVSLCGCLGTDVKKAGRIWSRFLPPANW
jgi:hypothetical protein